MEARFSPIISESLKTLTLQLQRGILGATADTDMRSHHLRSDIQGQCFIHSEL